MESRIVENTLFSKNIVYCTTLYLAAQNGHKDIVKYISDLAIDTVGRGLAEFTQIFLSAQNGKYDTVKRAIEDMFPDNELPDIDGNNDNTSEEEIEEEEEALDVPVCNTIHEAAKVGAENLMRSFISTAGADVDAENDEGFTALQMAAKHGKSKCVEILIQEGASVNYKVKGNDGDVNNGKTSLHLACEYGRFRSSSKLLSYGADPELMDSKGNVPLYYAVKHGSKRIVQLLLTKGVNINAVNNREDTVITEARNENVINLLLKNGFNYKCISSQYGYSILHDAIGFDNYFLVNFLLENKIRINVELKNKYGYSPLLLAAYFNKCSVMKVLFKYCNINSINDDGENALHVCARLGSTEAGQLLLEFGSNVNAITTKTKQTPVILAAKHNKVDTLKLLLLHDADIKIKDSKNKNALDYAIENNNEEIIQILRTHYK